MSPAGRRGAEQILSRQLFSTPLTNCAIAFAALALWTSATAADPTDAFRASDPVSIAAKGFDPTVAWDEGSRAKFIAWVRPGKPALEVVVARSDDGKAGFLAPVVVSAGDADIVSSAVNPAQVAVGRKGEVYVLYQRRAPSPYLESGKGILRLARSTDGGRSFAPPVDVVTDTVETSADAAALALAPDGALLVAWIDRRDALARAKLPEDQRPKDDRWIRSDDPKVEVRLARSIDGGASFTPSVSIATGASERSRISLAIGADGIYYSAWRTSLDAFKGSYDTVRDVMVASSSDQGATWSAPVKVHNDRFKAGSCPQIAHGIGVDSKGRLHVAWYTGASGRPGVYYAVSTDRGKSFSAPLTLLADTWVPYSNVKLSVDGIDRAWVAFEDRRDDRAERVALNRIEPQGNVTQIGSWPGRAPDFAVGASAVTLVSNGDKGDIQILQILDAVSK